MNSTPPIARLSTSLVFGAVCPTYWPTRSSRVTATRCPRLKVAQPVQQLGHPQRHRGLAGARVAGEAHVQVGPRRAQSEPGPHPVDQQQRGDLGDPGLHRAQPDQLVVQRGQDLVDAGVGARGGQVDDRVVGQRLDGRVGPAGPARRRGAPGRGHAEGGPAGLWFAHHRSAHLGGAAVALARPGARSRSRGWRTACGGLARSAAVQPEAGLVGGPVDDEGQRRGLPAERWRRRR